MTPTRSDFVICSRLSAEPEERPRTRQAVALRPCQNTFRFVCAPSALAGTPAGWAREMLEEGEVALLGAEGLDAVDRVAHDLDQRAIVLVRTEQGRDLQDQTVMAYAEALPLVWVATGVQRRGKESGHAIAVR